MRARRTTSSVRVCQPARLSSPTTQTKAQILHGLPVRPLLLLGPAQCHISDLIEKHRIGWRIAHGDVAGAESVLLEILATPPEELQAMGQRAAAAIEGAMSRKVLLTQFCDLLARGLPPLGSPSKKALRAAAP